MNKTILNFFENGLFKEPQDKNAKETLTKEFESELFEAGLELYSKQIEEIIKERLPCKEYYASLAGIKISFDKLGLYLYGCDYPIYQFTSSSNEKKVEELELNTDLIVDYTLEKLIKMLDIYENNKKLFSNVLKYLLKQEKEFFDVDYDFFCTIEGKKRNPFIRTEPILIGSMHPNANHMRVSFLGMTTYLKLPTNESFETTTYTSIEAERLLKEVVLTFKEQFPNECQKQVLLNLKKLLTSRHELPPVKLKVIEVSLTEEKLTTDFDKVYIPLDVKFEELEDIVKMLNILPLYETLEEEIKDVFKSSFKGNFLHKEKKCDFNYIANNFYQICSEIVQSIYNLKNALNSSAENTELKDFSYGNSLFAKRNKEFNFNGSKFTRIDYRIPGCKKTKRLVYENGKRISENRFFRCLRKQKKIS